MEKWYIRFILSGLYRGIYFLKGAKMVIDEHHIVTSMFFSDCQGNGIKDYANYSVPTFSKEERLQS